MWLVHVGTLPSTVIAWHITVMASSHSPLNTPRIPWEESLSEGLSVLVQPWRRLWGTGWHYSLGKGSELYKHRELQLSMGLQLHLSALTVDMMRLASLSACLCNFNCGEEL